VNGRIISHYKIVEKLGAGGMGVVYQAEDFKLKRTVALKFLLAEWTRDQETKERFTQAAQTASALDHPNICTIHEINQTDDSQMYIVMAYYEGQTLKDKIAPVEKQGHASPHATGGASSDVTGRAALTIDEIIDIASQIVQGLAAAHEKGIVHRDINPANIMICKNGLVKILDFGLAKLAGLSQLTKTGTTLGTAGFRATYYPKSYYLLGKIYQAKGDYAAAMEHYQKLLTLWKDADPDLPVLIETKRRLQELKAL